MITMKNKFLIIVMCLLLVCSMLLASCSNGNQTDEEQTDGSSVKTEESGGPLDELYVSDLGGRDFVIMAEYAQGHFPSEIVGEPISDVKYNRAEFIKEKYNVNIKCIDVPIFYHALNNAHMSGTAEYDLLFPHPTAHMQTMMTMGLFANLKDTEYIKLSQVWYNQSQVNSYETNGKLYLCVPDATIVDTGFVSLLYNRDMYADLGLTEDLYAMVDGGKWTVEAFKQILAKTVSSNSGNEENTTYGLALWANGAPSAFQVAMGQDVLKKSADGKFEIALSSKKLISIAEKFNDLLKSCDVISSESNTAGYPLSDTWKAFESGKSLFITHDIGVYHTLLRDVSFDIGFLPLPKYDEDQKDYRVSCVAGFWAIPANVKSLDESGIIVEALAVYSHVYLRPEFYETVLLGRMSNKSADFDMLDRIHLSKVYNLGATLDTDKNIAMAVLYNTVIKDGDPNGVAVYLKVNQNSIQSLADMANGMGK